MQSAIKLDYAFRYIEKVRKKILFCIGIFFSLIVGVNTQSKPVYGEETKPVLKCMLQPIGNESKKEGIIYYTEGVIAQLSIKNKIFDNKENIEIEAIPQDRLSEQSVRWSENENEQGNYDIIGWESNDQGENGEIIFSFSEEGKWEFRIRYGSEMEYDSETFVIDNNKPIFKVNYGGIFEINNDCANIRNVNKIIQTLKKIDSSQCEVFTQKAGNIEIEIIEDYFFPEDVKLKLVQIDYENEKQNEIMNLYDGQSKNWERKDNVYKLRLNIEEEGHYRLQLDYCDPAGWKLQGESQEENDCMSGGQYLGPMYTVDQTDPIIEPVCYQAEPDGQCSEIPCFVQEPIMILKVIEENFNQADFTFQDKLLYSDGSRVSPSLCEGDYELCWSSRYENGRRINEVKLTVKKQANHIFNMLVTDSSGRISDRMKAEVIYDNGQPMICYRADRLHEGDILVDSKNIWFLPYRSYRYFSRKKIRLSVTARDAISGIKNIACYFTDEKGNLLWNSVKEAELHKDTVKEGLAEYQAVFELGDDDFKGNFHVTAEDNCGVQSSKINGKGIVFETEELHKKISELEISLPKADFTDEKKKVKYFRHSIKIKVSGEDSCSGIRELKVIAGKKEMDTSEPEEKVSVLEDYSKDKDVIYAGEKMIELEERQFIGTCQENPVVFESEMKDNAGHINKKKYEEYKIVIDSQKPKISIDYDDYHARNKKYYNRTRIAIVTVEDWNFNSASVEWHITGSNRKYSIGDWNDDGKYHRCRIVFSQDGEDYKIGLTAADYAGNQTQWGEENSFTIDKTPPVIALEMNKQGVQNKKYFSTDKKVFFTVRDRNISEKEIKLHINNRYEEGIPVHKSVRRMHKEGDKFSFNEVLYFHKDGKYSVSARCTDLAGNVSEIVRIPEFILDKTKPKLQIFGVEKGMAYSGRISPMIICSDYNLNDKSFRAEICRIDGTQIDSLKKRQISSIKNRINIKKNKGMKIRWKDFPRKRWADGIYILRVYGEDYAGNKIPHKNGILFYVNRFGATYALGKRTEKIQKKGYIREEKDIVLKELSVTDTEAYISVMKDNQESKVLSRSRIKDEKAGYLIKNLDTSNNKNGKRGWYEKEYCILKENFTEEGTYQVTIYSNSYVYQDGDKKEIKETSNEIQNQPIHFTVDKTPPVIQISGLEERIYREKKHEIIITALDNYGLEKFELKIHYGKGDKKDVTYQFAAEDFGDTHSRRVILDGYEGIQTINYKAWDYAGNCSDSEQEGKKLSCIISEDNKKQSKYKSTSIHKINPMVWIAIEIGVIMWLMQKKRNL